VKDVKIPLPCCQCQQAFVLCLLLWRRKLPPHLDLSLHSAMDHFHELNNIEGVYTFSSNKNHLRFQRIWFRIHQPVLGLWMLAQPKKKARKVYMIYSYEHHKSTYTHIHIYKTTRKEARRCYLSIGGIKTEPNPLQTSPPRRPLTRMFG
jgi:hypothetical protein